MRPHTIIPGSLSSSWITTWEFTSDQYMQLCQLTCLLSLKLKHASSVQNMFSQKSGSASARITVVTKNASCLLASSSWSGWSNNGQYGLNFNVFSILCTLLWEIPSSVGALHLQVNLQVLRYTKQQPSVDFNRCKSIVDATLLGR